MASSNIICVFKYYKVLLLVFGLQEEIILVTQEVRLRCKDLVHSQ